MAATLSDFREGLFKPWLNRPDITLDLANMFINRALARCSRELRLPCMEATLRAAPDAYGRYSAVIIPQNFQEAMRLEADGVTLQMTTPEFLLRNIGGQAVGPINTIGGYADPTVVPTGCPKFYTRVQGQFLLAPAASNYAALFYYSSFPALVLDTDSNAMLGLAPDTLCWAALSLAGSYYRMDEEVTWEQRFQADRDLLKQQSQDTDNGGGPQLVQACYDGGYL